MKVSEWLRQYQITGVVPEAPKGEELIAFWAGWLMGTSSRDSIIGKNAVERLEMSIKAAAFIEAHAKG